VLLEVPPMPRLVDASVFDAWSWCASDVVEWRCAGTLRDGSVDATNPPDLAFVMREEVTFLPRELARLHVRGYDLRDELALAPYAIDDATDLLFEHKKRPRDVFWLAASTLPALVWGLHDWVHFHNHGSFEDPASTELQCDLVALAWLRLNQDRIGLSRATLDRVARELARLSGSRFEEPPFDLEAAFAGDYPLRLSARVKSA
jgi:hypothetical protein